MAARQREQRKKARLRAEAREVRRSRMHLRRRIRRYLVGGIVGFGGLMVVLSMVMPNTLRNITPGGGSSTTSEQGVQVAIQANEVIGAGESHPDYSTNPPTSGWRYDIPLEEMTWGVRQEPVENEAQVAYLERGGIMVQYKCPDGCPEVLQQLERVVNRYPLGVVMAPNLNMDTTIAVTAWGWRLNLASFDDPKIDGFIRAHIDQGPERFQ